MIDVTPEIEKLLNDLNEVQRDAVLFEGGPLLLLAGAGSGKTRVVTRRIVRMIASGVPARNILALTFTNRAAKEMRTRIDELLCDLFGEKEKSLRELTVSTFHSLGARFLRQYAGRFGRTESFTIYDDADQRSVVKVILEKVGAPTTQVLQKAICRAFDLAKNAGLEPEDSTPPPDAISMLLDMRQIGRMYEEALARADAFDFGDLILRPAKLLEEDAELRAAIQRRWPRICVDEFQDTNEAQYRWLRCLAPPGSDLLVVGDDDQSIYGWRGAEVGNILHFPEEYEGARVLRMEQNYRSVKRILNAANQVIAQNQQRLGKDLWSALGDGRAVEVQACENARQEAQFVARRISAMCANEGVSPGDVALLVRSNYLTLDFEEALRRENVPYVLVRGRSFFERACVQDAIAYLRLIHNHKDDVAFRRAIASTSRGVGKKSLEKLAAIAIAEQSSLYEVSLGKPKCTKRVLEGLAAFHEVLRAYDSETTLAKRAYALFKAAGLFDAATWAKSLNEEDVQASSNIERLVVAIETYEDEAEEPTLAGFLEQIQLIGEADTLEDHGGAVSIMTIHAAKGLEFPVVFVVGLEEGIFPSNRSLAAGDVEEERRLCYVAMTRARERLFLSWARWRQTYGEGRTSRPSRFLDELPSEVRVSGVSESRSRTISRPSIENFAPFAVRKRTVENSLKSAGSATPWTDAMYVDPVYEETSQIRKKHKDSRFIETTCIDTQYSDPVYSEVGCGAVRTVAEDEWSAGDHVLHGRYGEGVIEEIRGGFGAAARVVVRFSDGEQKTILKQFLSRLGDE